MRAPVRVLHLAASFGLVAASVLAGFTGTDVYLPSVGSAMGVSPWYTTVWVYNPGSSPANVTFYLLKRQANPSPSQFTDTVPPGDVKRYDDAVQFMFHESVFGALRITSNEKILVSSRVYSRAQTAPDRDSKGQFFGGVPASFAIGAGEKTQIVGARQTSSDRNTADFRFNLGVVETTGASCVVTWRLLDETGAAVGSPVSWNLGAREQRQENLWSMFGTGVPNGRVEVEVSSGSGKVIAFGSSVANGSDDPSTVEMYFADSLLADGSSSGGDITAVIAGQGLTGGGTSGDVTLHVGAGAGIQVNADSVQVASGGITGAMLATDAVDNTKIKDGEVKTNDLANASVTYAKISPAGGSNSQVLKIVSGSVQWAADDAGGLTLPYSGSATSGVAAFEVSNSSSGPAVFGKSTGSNVGVLGSSSGNHGVLGSTTASTAYGVAGQHNTTLNFGYLGGANEGVRGKNSSGNYGYLGSSGYGAYGENTSGNYGYLGSSSYGAYGRNNNGNYGYLGGPVNGVYGFAASTNGNGVLGIANNDADAIGVWGKSSSGYGVYGSGPGGNYGYLGGPGIAVYGGNSNGNYGALGGSDYAVYGVHASGAGGGFGLFGSSVWSGIWGVFAFKGGGRAAGLFAGGIAVDGDLAVSGVKHFVIDHPLDPEHKTLRHACIESSEVLNQYSGNVVTDENGFAEITLPEWFEALNKDFRYQLTVIGRFAQAIVEEEIHNNRFTIRTNFGHVKVSWQVTGVRNDAYMRAHPMVVEEVKPPEEQGTYLSPKEWGQPEEKGRDYPIIQKMREEQAKHQEEMAKHRDEAAKLRAPAGQQ
jgi:hypothetical protein